MTSGDAKLVGIIPFIVLRSVTSAKATMKKRVWGWIFAIAFGLVPLISEAGTIVYYHNDLLGSPAVATDVTGNVIWRESYRPYGERLTNDPASSANDVWFTSRRQDAASGLVYMGARYYDPVVGRFLSPDPMGFNESNLHSFNRYAYANNNPFKFVDPTGREGVNTLWMDDDAAVVVVGRSFGGVAAYMKGIATGDEALAKAAADGLSADEKSNRQTAIILMSLGRGGTPRAGGGASLENLSAEEAQRIQNAADRTGTTVTLVGSRAKGGAGPNSDYDYVLEGGKGNIKNSLPEGPRGLGEPRNQDFFKGPVDTSKPYITFTPTSGP